MAPRRILLTALLTGFLLQASAPLFADARFEARAAEAPRQTVSPTTGTISGSVTDESGALLPGVSIIVSGDALMGAREAITDQQGLYRIPALPPGEYVVAFARDGFKTVNRGGLYVGAGFTATIDITLEMAMLHEDVVVERTSPPIDGHSTAIVETFDARRLANLPSARTMWALQGTAPAVHMGWFDVGGSAAATPSGTTAYGTAGLNRPTVEGISVAGINLTALTLDYGSFREVAVRTAAHGPEWHTPGVHTEFISKSGGNQYRGTVYADYENRSWQWFNIDEDQIQRGVTGGGGLAPRDTNRLWRYRDINADAGGYVVKDTLWWYFSFRHQEVGARQVNFPVRPLETFLTNYTGKTTYQITRNNSLVAFAQVGRNHQPNRLRPFGPQGFGGNAATALHQSEDATAEQRALGWIGKIEWNSVFRNQLFLELRAGEFGSRLPERPNGTAPRFEDVGTPIVSGGNRDWQQNFKRTQLLGSVSHFTRGWIGHHHLKAGGEIFRTMDSELWRKAYPGDVLHVLRHGDPIEVYLFETPSSSTTGLWTYSGYASDSWRLNSRATLNLGLRFDRYRVFLPRQQHPAGRFNPTPQTFPAVDVIAWNVLVPRLGAVYRLPGHGRTVAKLSYGRYRIAPGTLVGANANPNANPWWRRHEWTDPDRSGLWEPGEEGRELGRRGGIAVESIDPGVQLPIHDEIAAWIERELIAGLAVRTGVVWRSARQPWSRQNANQPFEAFTIPVTIRDPGPDGVLGTADDGPVLGGYSLRDEFLGLPQASIVRNVPGADGHYWTWDLSAARRFGARWSLTAGVAHTWNRDQASGYAGQTVRSNVYPLTPNDLINTGQDGQHEFTTWTAKAYGTYEAPRGFRITPLLRHQSGQPFGRTFQTTALNYGSVRLLAEPIGARRMDHITILDVRAEKGFRLPGNRRFAAFFDIFNLLNANPELNVNWSSGPSFLRPLAVLPPRIARVGTKVEW